MKSKKISLGVIILNYGLPSYTLKLINSLVKYSEISKIIVIDNYSKSKNFDVLKINIKKINNRKIILRKKKNLGYASGNNFGLKICFNTFNLKYALILNPDIELNTKTNFSCIKKLNFKDKILFTGQIREKGYSYSLLELNKLNFISHKYKKLISNQKLPIYVSGSCIGFTKGLWTVLRGFDEDYFLYYEELDLIYKYKKKFNIFPKVVSLKQLKVNHLKNKLMIDKNNNYTTTVDYWSSFSRMLFAKKNLPNFIFNALAYNLLKSLFRLTQFKFHNFFLILFGTIRGILK